jgi:hypothetical protein
VNASREEPGLSPGAVFAGRYRVVRFLGEGDRKRTYLAEDTIVPRRVALAVIKPEAQGSDPEGTRREADALARAGTHDNVVTFHDWGQSDGAEYLVFDYLSGGTLRELLAKREQQGSPVSPDQVMRYGRQLARALSHVHTLGLIHRDVSPGNIWLDERLVAHLGDFDSAVGRDAASSPAGLPPTTEAYAAPEQLADGPFDERVDLYSLGAVLYEILTRQRPDQDPARRIVRLRPDAPPALVGVICSMLSQSPDDRPASADEVLRALQAARVDETASDSRHTWPDSLPFPLASILWHYEGEPDPAARIDYLLKFFEALALVGATIMLSGCMNDADLVHNDLLQWIGPAARRMDRQVTFGTWLTLGDRLMAPIRAMLDGPEGRARGFELFATPDLQLIRNLVSTDLHDILSQAQRYRNYWAGHGGVAGTRILRERLGELADLLKRTRNLLGWSFEPWTLLKPGAMTWSGGVFDLTATVLNGPNAAFRRRRVQVTEALDARRLYLLNDGSRQALELVPFIRMLVGKTGEDACYFYSRVEATGVRWVSYHFHADPELVLADDELVEFLAKLNPKATS